MKGGRRMLTMAKPWKAPMPMPIRMVTRQASAIGTCATSSRATTVLASPTTAPTDRSMPAVMMTKVWPMAMMIHSEAWRIRLVKLP